MPTNISMSPRATPPELQVARSSLQGRLFGRRRSLRHSKTGRLIRRHLATAARIVLGLVFFVCGLNGFLHFMPLPTDPMPEGAMAFGGALMNSGYMFPLIKGTEVLAGLFLLASRCVPLALTLLAPVLVNILAFHVFLLPSGTTIALLLVGLEIYLAWAHRDAFRPLLAVRSPQPRAQRDPGISAPAQEPASVAG